MPVINKNRCRSARVWGVLLVPVLFGFGPSSLGLAFAKQTDAGWQSRTRKL